MVEPCGWMKGTWVVAITLGVTAASCTLQSGRQSPHPPTGHGARCGHHGHHAGGLRPTASELRSQPGPECGYSLFLTSTALPINSGSRTRCRAPALRAQQPVVAVLTLWAKLTSTEAVLTLRQQSARSEQRSSLDKARRLRSGQALRNPGRERGDSPDFIRATTEAVLWTPNPRPQTPDSGLVLRLQLAGANPNPHIAGLEELPGKVNYLLGNDLTKWRTNISTYAKVQYSVAVD